MSFLRVKTSIFSLLIWLEASEMPWTSSRCKFKTSRSAVRPVRPVDRPVAVRPVDRPVRSGPVWLFQTGTGTGRRKSRPVPSMVLSKFLVSMLFGENCIAEKKDHRKSTVCFYVFAWKFRWSECSVISFSAMRYTIEKKSRVFLLSIEWTISSNDQYEQNWSIVYRLATSLGTWQRSRNIFSFLFVFGEL